MLRAVIAEVTFLVERAHDVNLWAQSHRVAWTPRYPVYIAPSLERFALEALALVAGAQQRVVSGLLVQLRDAMSEANATPLARAQAIPAQAVMRAAKALLPHLNEAEARAP
jgi:hypothetical protein